MKIKRTIAMGIIGCFLFSGLALAEPASAAAGKTANLNESIVAADQSVRINSEAIREKSDLLEIDISYPVIHGLSDPRFQEDLNYFIKMQIIIAKDAIEGQAEEYAQIVKESDGEIRQHQLFIEYDLKSNDEAYLSFTMTYYTYTAGANGMTVMHGINIDKAANKPIHLGALFPAGTNYKEIIDEKIREQIEWRSQDDMELFFEGEMGFQGISDSQGFYLKDNDVVIVFPKYEIAPGLMGIPEFPINLCELQGSLLLADKSGIIIEGLEIEGILNPDDQVLMIPLRSVAEKLGYTVNWNADERNVELFKGAQWTQIKVDDNQYFFAKMAPFALEAAPRIIDDRTYLPVSFLEKVLQYKL